MTLTVTQKSGHSIALVQSDTLLLTDVQSALDLIATIHYESQCERIALNKEAISEDFFQLSTRLAGDILQKFVTYGIKFAIIGDFSHYTSKALKDFIYESNRGRCIFFASSEEDALDKLSK